MLLQGGMLVLSVFMVCAPNQVFIELCSVFIVVNIGGLLPGTGPPAAMQPSCPDGIP